MEDKQSKKYSEGKEEIDSDYENAGIVLDICKAEYENEKTRTNTIDSKISIIAAIVMAAIALLVTIIDYKNLSNITFNDAKEATAFIVKLTASAGSFLLLLSSLIILLISVLTRKYVSIDCYTYLQVEKLKEQQCYYQLICANKYAECCNHNREVNEKRCNLYNISILLLLIGLAFMAGFLILKCVL